jgi:hypothetical protein
MATVETSWPSVRFGAIGEAWGMYKRHPGVWSLAMLISLVCSGFGGGVAQLVLHLVSMGMLGGLVGLESPAAPLVNVVITTMFAGFFIGGMVRMAVNQVRGRAPRIEDLFTVTDVWFDLVLGSALLAILIAVGWSLLVVPGLVAAGLLMFTLPLIVDGHLPATGAMIQSYHALKDQWLLATFVQLAIAAVTGLGMAFCGVGLLITGPIAALSIAILYRDLFLSPDAATWSKPEDLHREF